MSLKRSLLTLLLVGLILCPAAALGETAGIANQVPIIYISDRTGPADTLMDDDATTAWLGGADEAEWTILTASSTVREIWVRSGARQDAGSYLASGRPALMEVTVYYENQQVATYRYRLLDVYAAENTRDWVDGYQRLLLPRAINGVFCIELKMLSGVQGQHSSEIALSDILLSSGQPSSSRANVRMQAPAPTVGPVNATLPPISGNVSSDFPTSLPQEQEMNGATPTDLPSSGGVGMTATVLKQLGVRSGPGTGYDYVGSFFQGGEMVQVISKVWDPVNELHWDQIDFYAGGAHYRGYCVHELRIGLDPSEIPDDPAGASATILERTPNYYGPGGDYKAHNDNIFATTTGKVYGRENGYVLFDWYDGRNNQLRRAWVPESVIGQ